jgi:hypothetical protein
MGVFKMSIEKDLTRIADALEKIAQRPNVFSPPVPGGITAVIPEPVEVVKQTRTRKPALTPEVTKPVEKTPEAVPAISIDEMRIKLKDYAIKNGKDAARALVAKCGAPNVSALTAEQGEKLMSLINGPAVQDDDFTA